MAGRTGKGIGRIACLTSCQHLVSATSTGPGQNHPRVSQK